MYDPAVPEVLPGIGWGGRRVRRGDDDLHVERGVAGGVDVGGVGAVAAVDVGGPAVAGVELVVARAAEHRVAPALGDQRVVPGVAVEGITPTGGGVQVVVAAAAGHLLHGAVERVAPAGSDGRGRPAGLGAVEVDGQPDRLRRVVDQVGAGPAGEVVVEVPAHQRVVAVAAVQVRGAANAAAQAVVARAAHDRVAAAPADDRVRPRPADERVGSGVADQDAGARGRPEDHLHVGLDVVRTDQRQPDAVVGDAVQ